MSRSLVRFLMYLLIAALPLQGYAAGGCCAKADRAPVPHCGMPGTPGMPGDMDGMHAMPDMHATDGAQAHGAHGGLTVPLSLDPGCAMHAAHHAGGGTTHDHCSSCASCCAAAFAPAPASPTLAGALPRRVAHAPPLAPSANHIPAGLERPPRPILS